MVGLRLLEREMVGLRLLEREKGEYWRVEPQLPQDQTMEVKNGRE